MKDRELLKPMVKLVGNMHGNEAVAHEVMMHCSMVELWWVGSQRQSTLMAKKTLLSNPDIKKTSYSSTTVRYCILQ